MTYALYFFAAIGLLWCIVCGPLMAWIIYECYHATSPTIYPIDRDGEKET